LVRGYKRKNFWLMETQPGNVNWKPINNVLDKGEARAMAWHAIGHGADAILYWQWRSALGGQEQYHGTLIDQSGQSRLFYSEARQIAADFLSTSDLIASSKTVADVAFLYCYDSHWSIQWQPHHKDFNYLEHLLHYYRPLAAQNISIDIISADLGLSGYKLVVSPALVILNDRRVAHIKAFVENGGHLVLTLRSGMKDEYNALLPMRQPGLLIKLTGVEVEEYYALMTPVPIMGDAWEGTSNIWAERLKVLDAEGTQVLARYGPSNGWLDGQPAITKHYYGKGWVIYVGVYLDEVSQKSLLQQITQDAEVEPSLETPSGVEASKRVNPVGGEIFILINHTRTPQQVELPWSANEHLHHQEVGHQLILEPYDVAVLTRAI
jgi:beta-galactosidase